jgi:ABC-type branched-subunit amino acid transport system ATPase component
MWMKRKTPFLKSIFLPRRLQAEYSEKIDQALEILTIFNPELSAGRYRQVKELPLVDRRRVEICRALLADPVLLLLDEPAAGMDPSETRELMTDIRKMKERVSSLSVIVIEHDMDVISDIAERVVVFNFGKKDLEGPSPKSEKRVGPGG